MPRDDLVIATRLLAMTVTDQKTDRKLSEFLSTMVEKYGERGYCVAPDETLHALFSTMYEEPHRLVVADDGQLCLEIMRRGLRHSLSQGWSATDIAQHVVSGYMERMRAFATEEELRAFVRTALAAT